ncbi:MAG TPA: PorP/SprF family type IX secretion system membrane protein [Flavobacteriales bacterium]
MSVSGELRVTRCGLRLNRSNPQRVTRNLLRLLGIILPLSWCLPDVSAQDIHFSQFFQTPYALSPASIGLFDGDYRVGGVFRQQWRSVTVPYRTFGIGGDARDLAGVKGLGGGAWLYTDRAGDSRLNTFQFSLGASWTQRFGASKEQSLTLGVQGGITSINIDYTALRFDAQYNGFQYDASLGNNEQFQRDALSHPDLHTGLTYRNAPDPRHELQIGVALFNLTKPDIAFFEAAPSPLDQRTVIHALGRFPVAPKLDVMPMLQWMGQGPFREFDIGGAVRYILLDRYGLLRAVRGGLYMRAADAGYAYAGLEHDDWLFGLSYDLNLSRLVPASRNRGGFELTAIRVFRKRPPVPARFKACPDQL